MDYLKYLVFLIPINWKRFHSSNKNEYLNIEDTLKSCELLSDFHLNLDI